MSRYFDGELLSAYENLNKEFECKKENVKLHEQIADLEAKLAEKEKLLSIAVLENTKLQEVQKHLDSDYVISLAQQVKNQDQDKISFAVDELEKAREMLFSAPYKFNYEEWLWVEELFDNQIKAIKGDK